MKKSAILILILFTGFATAQIVQRDSISGGELMISGNPAIDSLVTQTIEFTCLEKENQAEEPTKEVDPCSKSPKVRGYKIQIMYSKDRQNTRNTSREFAGKFPYLVPEMVYTSPDYRVLVGDYFTKRSAAMDLARVKKVYKGAFLVPWRVWCRKAK